MKIRAIPYLCLALSVSIGCEAPLEVNQNTLGLEESTRKTYAVSEFNFFLNSGGPLPSINVDGDFRGIHDNVLGGLSSLFVGFVGQIFGGENTTDALRSGETFMLLEWNRNLEVTNQGKNIVTWNVNWFEGASPSVNPCGVDCGLHFEENTEYASASPTSGKINAVLSGESLYTEGGSTTIRAAVFSTDLLTLHVRGLRLEAQTEGLEGNLTTGIIGGGISTEDFNSLVIPDLHSVISDRIAADCPAGACAPGSSGATLLGTFDLNSDGSVPLSEFRSHFIIDAFSAPDLDLVGNDGVDDSHSFGAFVSFVKATF